MNTSTKQKDENLFIVDEQFHRVNGHGGQFERLKLHVSIAHKLASEQAVFDDVHRTAKAAAALCGDSCHRTPLVLGAPFQYHVT